MSGKNNITSYVDALQGKGIYTFTSVTLPKDFSPGAKKGALHRLSYKHRLLMPRRGFFVIIPLEYREKGVVPASWYIDELMKFEESHYYVGLLSAASIYGASHQQSQEFQVISDKQLRAINVRNTNIKFYTNSNMPTALIRKIKTYTGYMNVSTPALTALDLVKFYYAVGYLNNVATVLAELAEEIERDDLLAALDHEYSITTSQRLGYLLELNEHINLSNIVYTWLQDKRYKLVPLLPNKQATEGHVNERWKLYVNETIEVDI